MEQNIKVGPKDFFLWVGAMLSFYVAVGSFIVLFFDYIDTVYPDVLNYNYYYYDPYSSGIRFAMASLVVLFPLYLFLMRLIRNDIKKEPAKSEFWVRRWTLMCTVFVASISIVVDLITLINTYLGGELTTPFLLKVIIVSLVAIAVFSHFLADIRGYWDKNPQYTRSLSWAVGLLIFCTLGAGFLIIGSPKAIRLYRFDDQKISDLQSIQWQIVNYWQTKESLPATLSDLNDPISGFVVPVDSQTVSAYEYIVTGKYSFNLCATFNADIQNNSPTVSSRMTTTYPVKAPVPMGDAPANIIKVIGKDLQNDSWYHTVGKECFNRTIDPQRYPPFSKIKNT